MASPPSQMAAEVADIPAMLAAQAEAVAAPLADWTAKLRLRPRWLVATLARGSSDHAAAYLRGLLMRHGVWTTSVPPSLLTHNAPTLPGEGVCAVALSQSGQSPDLCGALAALGRQGALTAAWVNAPDSPLARVASHVLPLAAGPEHSVPATKSCVAQCALALRWVAGWVDDEPLARSLADLPSLARAALALDWWAATAGRDRLIDCDRLLVLGRGLSLAVAHEVALKLKEVCGVQAEAFSTAEVRHGPQALITPGYPVICLATPGPEAGDVRRLAAELRSRGALVWLAGAAQDGPVDWPLPALPDARVGAIALLTGAYALVEALARARGRDPDRPPFLSKVTRTE